MGSAADLLVECFDSLEALFSALDARKPARVAGCVRVHPTRFWGKRLADHIAVRKRLEAYGLQLLITSAIDPDSVELKRYKPTSGADAR